MDTRLGTIRHRSKLGRGAIAEGRVTAHPIAGLPDVLEDVLSRFAARKNRAEDYLPTSLHTGIISGDELRRCRSSFIQRFTFIAVAASSIAAAVSGARGIGLFACRGWRISSKSLPPTGVRSRMSCLNFSVRL